MRELTDREGPKDRLHSLTSLRFVAALLVFANHAADHYVTPATPTYVALQTGFIGVTFFFVLSGFVLTWAHKADEPCAGFYRNRVARIVPDYLVAWVIAVPVAIATGLVLTPLGVVASLGLVQAWFPDPDVHFAVNPVGWTLSVEAFFYLTFPFLVGPLGRLAGRGRAVAMFGCVAATFGWAVLGCLAAPDARHWIAYVFPLARLPEFVLGILLACSVRAGGWQRLRLGPALLATAAAWGLVLVVPRPFRIASVVVVPFALVIAAAAHADQAGRTPRLLGARAMVRLGEWSYAFYLLHELVIRGLTDHLGLDDLEAGPAVVTVLVLLVVAIAASGLMVALVEKPAQRWLRARWSARPAPVAARSDARGARSARQ